MPVEHARFMIDALCTAGVVEKDRFRVPFAGKIWEVDVFRGRHAGLVLAEVELLSENEEVELPKWVGEEVSFDPRYTNQALAAGPGWM